MNSCPWGLNKANLAKFHEEEWGRPVHEDNKLFEFLSLSVLAAGLSYETILDKRDDLCLAFHDFEIDKVAQMSPEEIERILCDKKMIETKRKFQPLFAMRRSVKKCAQMGRRWMIFSGVIPVSEQLTISGFMQR